MNKPIEIKREWIYAIRDRIRATANTSEQLNILRIDETYGAPAGFWNTARVFRLCSEIEVEIAREFYGELWNYRGD